MAFPKYDMQYALIMDAATSMEDMPRGFGAILTKIDKDGKLCAIFLALWQLRDHEKNYSPFLLEATAAMREMDIFNKYL
jgi:alpha-D-ribose 1-methylphosphonate 5-triphosphate synthase subunit PhnG